MLLIPGVTEILVDTAKSNTPNHKLPTDTFESA